MHRTDLEWKGTIVILRICHGISRMPTTLLLTLRYQRNFDRSNCAGCYPISRHSGNSDPRKISIALIPSSEAKHKALAIFAGALCYKQLVDGGAGWVNS